MYYKQFSKDLLYLELTKTPSVNILSSYKYASFTLLVP